MSKQKKKRPFDYLDEIEQDVRSMSKQEYVDFLKELRSELEIKIEVNETELENGIV